MVRPRPERDCERASAATRNHGASSLSGRSDVMRPGNPRRGRPPRNGGTNTWVSGDYRGSRTRRHSPGDERVALDADVSRGKKYRPWSVTAPRRQAAITSGGGCSEFVEWSDKPKRTGLGAVVALRFFRALFLLVPSLFVAAAALQPSLPSRHASQFVSQRAAAWLPASRTKSRCASGTAARRPGWRLPLGRRTDDNFNWGKNASRFPPARAGAEQTAPHGDRPVTPGHTTSRARAAGFAEWFERRSERRGHRRRRGQRLAIRTQTGRL